MGDGTLAAKVDYATAAYPNAVALGDLNGDGMLDIVTAGGDSSRGTVSVLLGTGEGTFAAKVDYTTGNGPSSVALRDLNGDGKLDLVVASGAANTVSVLLGTDDGKFAPKVDNPGRGNPSSVVVSDLNGDGKLDLMTANQDTNVVSVLLGTGDGKFDAGPNCSTGGSPRAVTLGDVDGDGNLDLVTANYDVGTVSVLLGTGDGRFAAKVDYATGERPSWVALGDLNGDGKLDLAAATYAGFSSTVSVLLGTGGGKFAAKVDYTTGGLVNDANPPSAFSVALGDLNGDGKLDLVTANWSTSTVSVLLGTGGGKFAAKVDYPAGHEPLLGGAG